MEGQWARADPQRLSSEARFLRCIDCNAANRFTREKEVDTKMVADMLRLAAVNAFDVLVLVSGDADHAPAVEGVRALGKQAYVGSWGGHGLAQRLRNVAYDHVDLVLGADEFGLDDEESSDAQPGLEEGRKAFMEELQRAEAKFSDGYVGANYFVTRWHSQSLDPDPNVRRRLLKQLADEGHVEVYETADKKKAIRLK